MYINDLSPYVDHPTDEQMAYTAECEARHSEKRLKEVRQAIANIVDDEFDRIREYAQESITDTACKRAENFIEKVLRGDENAAMMLLGENGWTGRSEEQTPDRVRRFVSVIHGRLHVPDAQELRRNLALAIEDKVRDSRMLDLEDQVASLTEQLASLQSDLERTRARL